MNKKIWCLSAALLAGSVVFAAQAAKTVKVVQKDTQAIDAATKLFDSGDRAGQSAAAGVDQGRYSGSQSEFAVRRRQQ